MTGPPARICLRNSGITLPLLAEDVAEAHRDILRFRAPVHHLDDHLAHALGCAHHVCRVYGLVGGDEKEALRAELRRRFRDVQRAEHIILYRLGGESSISGTCLCAAAWIYKLRPVGVHDVENALAVAHGADEHDEIERRIAALQFLLDVVGVILVYIEDDQTADAVLFDLAAQLGADLCRRLR